MLFVMMVRWVVDYLLFFIIVLNNKIYIVIGIYYVLGEGYH